MPSLNGCFIWYELMTTDAEAAKAFYREVVGWGTQEAGLPDRDYTILSAAELPMGGLMALPPEARERGATPGWIGYVAADDVDAFATRVTQAGGAVHRPAEDIPGVGRFAVVADPQGAHFVLFTGAGEGPPRPALGTLGHTGWHELHAAELESAFAFYSGLFGWTKAEAIDMGAMGIYQLFAAGGVPVGGMMTNSADVPAPFWLYYFNVDAIEAAAARVRTAGGQIINGPHPVPGGSWIVHCVDPQGATFALVAPPA